MVQSELGIIQASARADITTLGSRPRAASAPSSGELAFPTSGSGAVSSSPSLGERQKTVEPSQTTVVAAERSAKTSRVTSGSTELF